MKNMKSFITYTVITLILIMSFFAILQILSTKKSEARLSKEQLLQESKAHFQSIVDTRLWNAKFGGVYVKQESGLEPNPYLKNNVLVIDENRSMIKINPAWMTRQISEISNKQGTHNFKITSLKPLNPSNKADAFEKEALEYFQDNKDKEYFYKFNNKNNSFDFMGSLVTKKACLECHKHQGYKVGDIRGGIRISIPTTVYDKQMNILEQKARNGIIIVLIVCIVLIVLFYWLINIFYKRQYEIEHAKEILEQKVKQRTQDLEIVVSREEHIIDILKIITEINEILITSGSTEKILKDVTKKLASVDIYSLVVSGVIADNTLEIVSKSKDDKNIITDKRIKLDNTQDLDYLSFSIKKAIELKHSIVEKISFDIVDDNKWVIVLPLLHGFDNEVYGVVAIFCQKEEGLDVEERKILENMSHDISIALYSHKQKNAIITMEKEKTANYEETILAFVNIIEQRDTYTAGHTIRVAEYCTLIAKQMGVSKSEIQRLEKAAILHDIGKVATPDTILLKPGKLSGLEYKLIKQHSEVGANMLERVSMYKDLAEIIRFHHSRYDGKGYPETSSPDEIPLLSHIMIVADSFDAMVTNRIYRPRKTFSESMKELKDLSGTQFHPDVVDAAMIALKDVKIGMTSQMPISELEKRRMSYFFHDSLTDLYNEDYLQTLLNRDKSAYKYLKVIELKRFSQYNKMYGWEEGNNLLKSFAEFLLENFKECIVIRYHGDDFVILHNDNVEVNMQKLLSFEAIEKNIIGVDIKHYDIDENFNCNDFEGA